MFRFVELSWNLSIAVFLGLWRVMSKFMTFIIVSVPE